MALRSSTLLAALVLLAVVYQTQAWPAAFEKRDRAAQIQLELDAARKILEAASDKELADFDATLKACVAKQNKGFEAALPELIVDAFGGAAASGGGRKKRSYYESFFKRDRAQLIDDILKNGKTMIELGSDAEIANVLKVEQAVAKGPAAKETQLVDFGIDFSKVCATVAKRERMMLALRALEEYQY